MTQARQHYFLSVSFSIAILLLSIYTTHAFIRAILWAGIIAIAIWPLYEKWLKVFNQHLFLSSLTFTALISLLIVIPCLYLSYILMRDIHFATMYLFHINHTGLPAPLWLEDWPIFHDQLSEFWENTLAKPNGLSALLSLDFFASLRTYSISAFKNVSGVIWHRLFTFVFSMLTLFFFFKDGKTILKQVHFIGDNTLPLRWQRYVSHLPLALRATVNGILMVAIGVGCLMGISYAYLNIPGPALMGIITTLFACVPFGAPIILCLLAGYLVINGALLSAIGLLSWGIVVMFIADHLIRPALIGGAARLPFLLVLFGILGGIRCFDILGLFLGPIIMVLFITLWQEWTNEHEPLTDTTSAEKRAQNKSYY